MIGAAVLVIALIIIAPAMLDGERQVGTTTDTSAKSGSEKALRTHTIRLDRQPDGPPVARALPADEPEASESVAVARQVPADTVDAPKDAPVKPVTKAKNQQLSETAPKPESKPKREPEQKAAAETRVQPKKSSPPAPAPSSGWAVQLGAFSQSDSARRLEAEVQKRGFSSYVVTVELAEKTWYRVRVGPEETRSQADRLAGKLADAGYQGGQVISQQPGS